MADANATVEKVSPVNWQGPVQYHALHYVTFRLEGWGIDQLYRKSYSIMQDLGYLTQEVRYVNVPPAQQGEGTFVAAWWRGSHEVDYKYAINWMFLNLKMYFTPKPKPGTDPKNPIMANHGWIEYKMDGFCRTDYLARWVGSPLLKFIRPMREKYFYYDKIEQFVELLRHDAKVFQEKVEEFANYLPTII
ncbi:MAG: hypothetical protein V1820_06130 [archaeon]